jgi:membrane associated rhomboid family serine protease
LYLETRCCAGKKYAQFVHNPPIQEPKPVRSGYSIKSVVIGLIIINVVVFLFTEIVNIPVPYRLVSALVDRGNMTLAQAFQRYGLFVTIFSLFPILIRQFGWVWQVFTYMFLHGSFWHLFFNMYALLLFGRALEQRWGKQRFFMFYIFTGVGAGIVTFIWNLFGNPYIPTIGASGAIFGIMLAFGLEFPDTMLLLFFLIPIRARYAAFIFGGIELIMIITGSMQGIGHFTHLAGLLFGYIFYIWRIRGRFSVKKTRTPNVRTRLRQAQMKGRETISAGMKEKVLEQAEILRSKLERGSNLTVQEERLLDKLRESYNKYGREICGPGEFEPRASDCLKCDALYACLYRFVLDIK